jgi:hypothetical protein
MVDPAAHSRFRRLTQYADYSVKENDLRLDFVELSYRIMEDRGWSLGQYAEAIGYPARFVSVVLAGEDSFSLQQISIMMEKIGLRVRLAVD